MESCDYCGAILHDADFCPRCGQMKERAPGERERNKNLINMQKKQVTTWAIVALAGAIAMLVYPFIDFLCLAMLAIFAVGYFIGLSKHGKLYKRGHVTKEENNKSTAFKLLISACAVFSVAIIIKAFVLFFALMGGFFLIIIGMLGAF